MRGSCRGFKTTSKLLLGEFYKLLGYELNKKIGASYFEYYIYWPKKYDAGCHEGDEVNGIGGQPTEAVEVKELLKDNPYPTRLGNLNIMPTENHTMGNKLSSKKVLNSEMSPKKGLNNPF
jgi:hypothetical protein